MNAMLRLATTWYEMIILIGAEKGGTGKTTIATNLAAELVSNGKDILLIDTDKQGSASSWAAVRDNQSDFPRVSSIQKFGSQIRKDILDLSKKYKNVVIDAGGRDSVELRSAMTVCDRLYIPIQASQFDAWTLGLMDQLVNESLIYNENLTAKIIINRGSTNPKVKEVSEVIELIDQLQNIGLATTIIRERSAYRKAARQGLSVCELVKKEQADKAKIEIQNLYKEIFGNEK